MDLATIPTFLEADIFHVVVESPRGSGLKLKYDPRWQAMSVSRPLQMGLRFPFDWGFVPSTRGPDGNPIDAFLVWDVSGVPGLVVPCRAMGVLRVEQNAVNFDKSRRIRNDRILALPLAARREGTWTTIDDIPQRVRDETAHFSAAAAAFEGKDVKILGWGDASDALALLAVSR